ncbi:hypothetical protein EW145_g8350, partial [Phellinidium pouzarii]
SQGTQGYRDTSNLDEVNIQPDSTHGQVQQNEKFQGQQGQQGAKPSFSEKMRGNAEKLAGSVTGNRDMKAHGQERKTGDTDDF